MGILVTGGSGVLGLHIVNCLAQRGEQVVVCSRSGSPYSANLLLGKNQSRVKFVAGDVTDQSQLEDMMNQFEIDGIVHAAALTGEIQAQARPDVVVTVNVTGTANVLNVARSHDVRRMIYIGSSAEYGQRLDLEPIAENEVSPDGIYSETKYLGHRLTKRFGQVYGMDLATVRVSSVYGPYTRFNAYRGLVGNTLIASLCRAVAFNEKFTVNQAMNYTRGWTYAADAAEGICLALFAPRLNYGTYNIASGELYTLEDVISAVTRVEVSAEIELFSEGGASQDQDKTVRGPLDITRAKSDFNFLPKYGLEDGLREYISWWRTLGKQGAEQFASANT